MLRSVLIGSALATSAILLAPVVGGSVAVDDVLSARTVATASRPSRSSITDCP